MLGKWRLVIFHGIYHEYPGTRSKHTLTFGDKYHAGYCCTCAYFVKQAVCSHIVGYDLIYKLNIFNLRIHRKNEDTFKVITKRGRKKGGSNRNKNTISKALDNDK